MNHLRSFANAYVHPTLPVTRTAFPRTQPFFNNVSSTDWIQTSTIHRKASLMVSSTPPPNTSSSTATTPTDAALPSYCTKERLQHFDWVYCRQNHSFHECGIVKKFHNVSLKLPTSSYTPSGSPTGTTPAPPPHSHTNTPAHESTSTVNLASSTSHLQNLPLTLSDPSTHYDSFMP